MNKRQFADAIVNVIYDIVKDDAIDLTVNVQNVNKHNGQNLLGLVFKTADNDAAPTFYVEEPYEDFMKGASLENIADVMVKEFYHVMDSLPSVNAVGVNVQSYENVRDRLVVRVLELERNVDFMKDRIYKDLGNGFGMFLDIRIASGDEGFSQASVTKDLRDNWYITDAVLWEQALQSTVKVAPPVLVPMSQMMFGGGVNLLEHPDELDSHELMLVLSTESGTYGASSLFIPSIAEEICELLGEGFYVLPSSVHEVLIVPESHDCTVADLRKMVYEANRTVVEPKDVLSDKVLHYGGATGRLEVA